MYQIMMHKNQHDQYLYKYANASRSHVLQTGVLELNICVHKLINLNAVMEPKKEDYLLNYLL